MARVSLSVALLAGRSDGVIVNGNDMGNEHAVTMLREWLSSGGQHLELLACVPGLPAERLVMVRLPDEATLRKLGLPRPTG